MCCTARITPRVFLQFSLSLLARCPARLPNGLTCVFPFVSPQSTGLFSLQSPDLYTSLDFSRAYLSLRRALGLTLVAYDVLFPFYFWQPRFASAPSNENRTSFLRSFFFTFYDDLGLKSSSLGLESSSMASSFLLWSHFWHHGRCWSPEASITK